MSIELEAKFFLNDLAAVRSRLEGLGAELIRPRTLETNLRFDTPDEQLGARKRLLRLRQDDGVRLTYKEPDVIVNGASRRLELEVTVSDFATMRNLLEHLGYQVSAIYEKYRTAYDWEGLYVTLDEMPFGDFMEIEGDRVEDIQGAADKLELDWSANITRNYLLLFNTLKENLSIKSMDMTFKELDCWTVKAKHLGVRAADGG